MTRSSSYSFGQCARIALSMGWSDFSLQYRSTALGMVWVFLKPALKFVVLYEVFNTLLGTNIRQYPLYLFSGIIFWEHFSVTTSQCVGILLQKQRLIQRIPFPRIVLMWSVGWTSFIVLGIHMAILLLATLILGSGISPRILFVSAAMLQMTALALGVGMILAAYSLRYRDIGHAWQIALQLLFWLTPVFYRPRLLESRIDDLIRYQPLSILLREVRTLLVYTDRSLDDSLWTIVLVSVFTAVVLACGIGLYQYRSRYFLHEY
ncbi:ABC transporter permease [Candidatus Peregrinibacteria bacterium]|nr:ABC transporter permease [Candidatus Peregrinibacteria bacterium]